MYVWASFLSEFNDILDKADFIITDDLAMQWYNLAHWVEKDTSFFTTDTIFTRKNLIKLWNDRASYIK